MVYSSDGVPNSGRGMSDTVCKLVIPPKTGIVNAVWFSSSYAVISRFAYEGIVCIVRMRVPLGFR